MSFVNCIISRLKCESFEIITIFTELSKIRMTRVSILVFCLISWSAIGQELHLTGVFKGNGLYIQNPYNAQKKEFCVRSIHVNGKLSDANLNLTAIYLPFKGVDLYAPVTVKVTYGDSCTAKIVNKDAILYHSSFKFDSLVLNDSIMHWYTKGDRPEGKYQVEMLHYNEWEVVKELRSKGRFDGAQYVYFPEHKDGGNKYRIKYELPNGRYLYSAELEHFHYPEGITFSPKVVKDEINLSRATTYEILDADGEVILKGNGKKIPLRLLKPGDYSIVLEGEVDTFVKK